jgi:hypothetical protein
MADIFSDYKIYPDEGKIKDHFKDFYDSVFIAFLPFTKVDRQLTANSNLKKSKQITFDELKQEVDIFKDIPSINADIYSYSNKDYPTDQEIFKSGQAISWDTIIKGAGLKDNSELNKALRTSIGALRQVFRRPDLTEKLNNYTTNHNIWHPTEGAFNTLSKSAIFKTFKLLQKNQICVTDMYYDKSKTLELDNLTDLEFSEKIDFTDSYIYSSDKELLFTIEWDSFFFLIATEKEKMNKIISSKLFEGFLCNEKTKHTWDYEEGEIQKYLDIEEKQKVMTAIPTTKKQWWKFWK